MRVIGIHGLKGSGKTTFTNILGQEMYNQQQIQVKVLPFAYALKKMCHALFGGADRNWFGSFEDKAEAATYWKELIGDDYATYRDIMVTIGTKVFRNKVFEHFWVASFNKQILDIHKGNIDVLFVDDVRFENEASYIRAIGGHVIHVHRNEIKKPDPTAIESEQGIAYQSNDSMYVFQSLDQMKTTSRKILSSLITNTKACVPCSPSKLLALLNSSESPKN
jgi:energy-coupling factor transporter ATP-binding protein EcfA2